MPGHTVRANDSAYELKVPAGDAEREPASEELARMRQLIHDLRNPVGSMSMAVEMLLGPLEAGIDAMDPEMARRVRGTLEAMSESARQMRYLVSDLDGLASGTRELVPNAVASECLDLRPGAEPANEVPSPSVPVAATVVPAPVTRARATRVDVCDLLRRLEILTVTRSALPSLLAVDAQGDLWVEANGPELLRALSNLVENGIEAAARAGEGSGPWTVDVRAYARDGEVRIEVHNQGAPLSAEVLAFLEHDLDSGLERPKQPASSKKETGLHGVGLGVVKRVAEAYGASIRGRSAAGVTVICLALPAAEAPTRGADEADAEARPAAEASSRADVAGTRPVLAVI